MTSKTSLEIECFCATCSNLLQPKAIRCKSNGGKDCFTIALETCKTCERKARLKVKKIRQRFHRRFSKPLRALELSQPQTQAQAQDQEAIMAKHAESGKFGDMTSGNQPFQD